jgi:hypothetical protein
MPSLRQKLVLPNYLFFPFVSKKLTGEHKFVLLRGFTQHLNPMVQDYANDLRIRKSRVKDIVRFLNCKYSSLPAPEKIVRTNFRKQKTHSLIFLVFFALFSKSPLLIYFTVV